MFRKFALPLAVVVALALLLLAFGISRMAPLTVTIGSDQIALVQNGPIVESQVGNISPTLSAASTAGTCLIVIAAHGATLGGTPVTTGFPVGWTRLVQISETVNADFEVWAYPNNPGQIKSISFQGTVVGVDWWSHMSEWSNVRSASLLATSGTATATTGTTLTPTATSSVLDAGDLALAGWVQRIITGTVIFTSPVGWSRLTDSGATSASKHIDLEYLLAPPVGGAALAPVLTSNTATNSTAAGAIVVLHRAPQAVDMTASLAY